MTAGFIRGRVTTPIGNASGTWTPVFEGAGGDPTVGYTNQLGTYYVMGDLVCASFFITWTTSSGGSGQLRVAGLPFTVRNVAPQTWMGSVITEGLDLLTTTSTLALEAEQGTDYMLLVGTVSLSTVIVIPAPISATGAVRGSITYVKG